MPKIQAFFALVVTIACAFAADPIPRSEYRARRAELRKNLDGPLVLFGMTEGSDQVFRLQQEPNFYYLTGWTEPGAILLVTPSEEILFLPNRNARRETYNGRRIAPDDPNAREETGFDIVMPVARFESQFARALDSGPAVYTLADRSEGARLKALAPLREFAGAGPAIAKLRVNKSATELAAIERATNVSLDAHRAAWKRLKPGAYEYDAMSAFMAVVLGSGCEGPSYAPIFGSGPNSTTLHYNADSRRMDAGEIIVIDAAAECGGYASDITRTLPVNGRFSARQREVYEIVLGAQKAAIAALKPGMTMQQLTEVAREYMNKHKDLKGQPMGKHFVHGLGHSVGIDVHDPGLTGPLAVGMVVTIEPGIYIPDENIGVRIEDVVLVTEKGAKLLSDALPREPDEIEKAMAR